MSDKVNMSLDEIIRASKAKRINQGAAGGSRNIVAKKQGARLSTGRGRAAGRPGTMRATFVNSKRPINNNFNKSKKIVKKAVAGLNQRNFARNVNANANSGMIPRSEVKNIVNKAVTLAIKKQNANIGIVGRLGGGQIPRNIITASKLAQLSQRSRTIQRNRAPVQMRQRGRGFNTQPVQIVEEIMSPQPAVRIVRQPIQSPVVQVVERIVPARQQVRRIGGRGGVIARGQQQQIARVGGGGRIIRQAPVQRFVQQQQRVIQRPAQRVVQQQQQPRFVQQRVIQRPAQRIIRQPQQQQIIYQQRVPQQQQQRVQVIRRQAPVQRVQVVRQAAPARNRQQNVQYEEYTEAPAAARNNKNNRMREALGLGNTRHVIRDTQRFEPSSSFLANRTISNSRGRGFTGRNAY